MNLWRWAGVVLAVACLSIGVLPAPTQGGGGEEGGSGCSIQGHVTVTPDNALGNECWTTFNGERTIWVAKTPDGTYDPACHPSVPGHPEYCPLMPVPTCPGEWFWVDVHADKFNVEGIYQINGTITFDENRFTYIGARTTEYFGTSCNVYHTGFGVLTLDLYNDANLTEPGWVNEVITRLLFRNVGVSNFIGAHIGVDGVRVYSTDPTLPWHEIPSANFCRRGSTIGLTNP